MFTSGCVFSVTIGLLTASPVWIGDERVIKVLFSAPRWVLEGLRVGG
jgi:hypothetical protein